MKLGELIYYSISIGFLLCVWAFLLYGILWVLPSNELKKAWLALILLSVFILGSIYSLILDIKKYKTPKSLNNNLLDDDLML